MIMKKKLNVGFITTVSGRWPRELPNQRLADYGQWLEQNLSNINLIKFESIIDSQERIEEAADTLKKNSVDVLIMLYGAFTGDDVCTYLAEQLGVPIILWSPYEPELGGGRLLANGLVALTMNSASLHRLGCKYHSIYGGKEDQNAAEKLISIINTYSTVKKLKGTIIGLFGYRPTAFFNSAFDEGLIRRTFGIRMEETDLKVVFDRMETIEASKITEDVNKIKQEYKQTELPEVHYTNHSKLFFALKELVSELNYDFSAIKCWPEMGNLKTTPCAVLGRLADEGVNIACEGDIDATLAMIVENYLTNEPTFITDLININEAENYLTFWHCGNAAPSLHSKRSETVLANHPLAGQGTAFRSTLKSGKVTIARFCNIDGKYKLFLLRGEAINADMYTPGTMVNVKTEQPVRDIIEGIIEKGVPHHYSIVWEDIADEMIAVAKLLGIEILEI
jgi:L-fucose isomerase-like protein